MTMPHLMNCRHSEDGWCLDCVKELHNERRESFRPAVDRFAMLMERRLKENAHKITWPRPTTKDCIYKIGILTQKIDANIRCSFDESKSKRDREEAFDAAELLSADLANWLLMMIGANVNKEFPD